MSTRNERLKDLRRRAIDATRLHEHAQRKYRRDQTATGIVRVTKDEMSYLVEPFIHEDKQKRADAFEAAHGWRALPMLKEIHAIYADDHEADVSMPGRFVIDLLDFDFRKKPKPEPFLDEPREVPTRKPSAPRYIDELTDFEVRLGNTKLPVFNFLILHGHRRATTVTLEMQFSLELLATLHEMLPTSHNTGVYPLVMRQASTGEKRLVGQMFITEIEPDNEGRMIRARLTPTRDLWMPTRSKPEPPEELADLLREAETNECIDN